MIYSLLKGRIGNNLFQIAAGHSLANRMNTGFKAVIPDFILPEPDLCTLKKYLEQFAENLLRNIDFTETLPEGVTRYSETKDLSYSRLPDIDNQLLEGYFQSEKYFDAGLVRDLFSVDPDTGNYIDKKYGQVLASQPVSINIRRGDFVKQPHLHPVCSTEFYKNAVRQLGQGKQFLVISDDIDWCRKILKGSNFHFVDNEVPAVDLYLQSKCSDNIISNSSFSWWGAWLNPRPGKTVIAPGENWTGKLHPYSYSDDLLPAEWIKLPNPLSLKARSIVFEKQMLKKLSVLKKSIKGKKAENG
jgi:hypothetical protein